MSKPEPIRNPMWAAYYQSHEGRPVSPLLKRALTCVDEGVMYRQAVDLGCGAGHETCFLIETGWQVLAVDKEPQAIERVHRLIDQDYHSRLDVRAIAFEELAELPDATLIHAGLSLPFCHPKSFASLWTMILSSLTPGGVFVGQLFGDRDDWSSNPAMTFHSGAAVADLLDGLDIRFMRELDEDGKSLRGPKRWHRFDIIATKPA
ncbi:class I SAM-dependent methyltransferase [Billgrantia aerodenitrificans]|nr:class I SAM-dependent methyltransferase [Halomonas aerodenitrificans]